MTLFGNLNTSSRFLATILSFISLFAISIFLWLGIVVYGSSNDMIHTVIFLSISFITLSWLSTLFYVRRLKQIRVREEELEELLYYHEVNKIHEISSKNEDLPASIMELQLNKETFFSELKSALENNQFVLHYQPIVNTVTGKINEVEALIRWQHPVHGLLFPASFLPLCENSNFMIPLCEWVLKTACHQLREWQKMGFSKLKISVNLSTLQLNNPELLSLITTTLQSNELPPDSLTLEITENSLMANTRHSIDILQAISNLGLNLSLDDFGTGYSSMQYLKGLPISNLKIDALFIKDMSTNITSLGIVESIITLGKSLGLSITAEGVENKNQLHILKNLGCDYLQGYFYSKSVPAEELTGLLQIEEKINENKIYDYIQEQKNYRYDVLKEEHFEQAVNVITHAFCEHEPLTKYLGITPFEFIPLARIIVKKAIEEGLSIVAMDNDMVAACTIVEDAANPLDTDLDIDPRFKIIFSLQSHLGNEFFSERAMYSGHIAHLFVTAVDENYHRQGLSRKINFESIRLAKERNFDFMCCEFTHNFNEKGTVIHMKNSRLLIKSCKYRDFVYNGEKPFAALDGHASAYIWELREGAKLRYKINA